MPTRAKCRIYRRKDGKYLVYLAKALAEDSNFPFPLSDVHEVYVLVSFKTGDKCLTLEPYHGEE